jgi:hypothetical protein
MISSIWFVVGAVWILCTITLGLVVARAWLTVRKQLHPEGLSEQALVELQSRVASLETKINLVMAFRKPEPK